MARDIRTLGVRSQRISELHRSALVALRRARCRFLVGGAYALARHTGLRSRPVKDLDLVVERSDVPVVREVLEDAGWSTALAYTHWLAKATRGGELVDIIFPSGNGAVHVDDGWFAHARAGRLFDVPVAYCPPEEEIWMRSYVMERERYDGADVAHLIRSCGGSLDWHRLLHRFGSHWRLLLSHLVLFGFIYPNERSCIPTWVEGELIARLRAEPHDDEAAGDAPVCQGTLLSRVEYQMDVGRRGHAARGHGPAPGERVDARRLLGRCPALDAKASAKLEALLETPRVAVPTLSLNSRASMRSEPASGGPAGLLARQARGDES